VFEDQDLNEQSAAVVEKAVHHGPNPTGESGMGEVERIESVAPNKADSK